MSTTLLLEHMHKKFEINRTQIKGGCQSGIKVVTHNFKSDLPLRGNKKIYERPSVLHSLYIYNEHCKNSHVQRSLEE